MSAFTFEALVGSLKIDISNWSTKLPVAQRQLSDFTKKAAAEAAAPRNDVIVSWNDAR